MLGIKEVLIKILTTLHNKVDKSGDTMTGVLTVQRANGVESFIRVRTLDSDGTEVGNTTLDVSLAGNAGIYNTKNKHWTIYEDSNGNTYVPSQRFVNSTSSVTWTSSLSTNFTKNCYLKKLSNHIVFIMFSLGRGNSEVYLPQNTTLCTLPSGWRPIAKESLPCLVVRNLNNIATCGTLVINTNGTITCNASSIMTNIYCCGVYTI